MFKPNIKKMIDKKNQLPPVPPIFEKDKLIDNINNELVNLKSGNYLVKLIDLKNGRRSWISYEYYLDTIYTITDLNNPKREFGLTVPGMGVKPVELNKQLKYYKSDFYDEHRYYENFWDQLWNRISRLQTSINEEGRYINEK
tara:strand:- start:377 stop:802 length:426 start_codon:yes stop_codon:yes gene_type:complete